MHRVANVGFVITFVYLLATSTFAEAVRSAQSGNWTAANTWENGRLPAQGDQVLIRPAHHVIYDRNASEPLRAVHIAGRLTFATDKDTRLDVGLIRIAADEKMTEEGFECDVAHDDHQGHAHGPQPTLQVGTPTKPVSAEHTALIRLVYFEGMDKKSLPAIVCCAGRMDFHGAPMSRTWVKLGDQAAVGESRLFLSSKVEGWKAGDRILITGTNRQRPFAGNATDHVSDNPTTEVRTLQQIQQSDRIEQIFDFPAVIGLDEPLKHPHRAQDGYAAEVANLSRNVIVESADPDGERGHTMYHRNSSGSISYAEFRHLGKQGVLGRYALHYHLVGDTMRGSSVIGASIWDSANRWLTIHGTQYLVVRDCIGYRSIGHGFYLEDGTEVYNVLDRNLAVQALVGKPLPKQALPFDQNDGGGFWWANSLNTFTRNVAVECDQHAFRFEAVDTKELDIRMEIRQPDGSTKLVDIRTLPFIRFEDNEAHTQRRFGLNLGGIRGKVYGGFARAQPQSVGGDVGGVGPAPSHPFVVKNFRAWDCHWAFHAGSPSVLVDGMDIYDSQYGIWRSVISLHEYKNLSFRDINSRAIHYPMGGYGPSIELKDGRPSFPILRPIDDFPPITIITHVSQRPDGLLEVRGTTTDNGTVKSVLVNDVEAEPTRSNFAEWKVVLTEPEDGKLSAYASDHKGNTELRPHHHMVFEQHP